MNEEEDFELKRLMSRRLAEMQKNISSRQKTGQSPEPAKGMQRAVTTKSSRDVLVDKLGFRGLEVLKNAELQFPNETRIIVDELSELIKTGRIDEIIDGGSLLTLFRTVGLSIRMQTRINVEQDGKLVSLSDKLGGIK